MELICFSKNRLAYLFKCSVDDLPNKISDYLKNNPLKIDIDHYMMLPHIDKLSVQLRSLGAKVESCDDIDLNILILGKTIGGIYVPTNEVDVNNIINSKIVYGFKNEFKGLMK